MPKIENIFTFHPNAVVAQDIDLVGDINVGSHCIIHPSCTIVALGPIVFGSGCIIEEQSVICNRRKTPMIIGDNNLFSVGCRIEAIAIASNNIFEAKCKVSPDIRIGNDCVIGAGCTVVAEPNMKTFELIEELSKNIEMEEIKMLENYRASGNEIRTLNDFSIICGQNSDLRTWSGEGKIQARALHAKHIQYLIETLPKFHRTRPIGPLKPKPT